MDGWGAFQVVGKSRSCPELVKGISQDSGTDDEHVLGG
jgi:hypothetical protein